MFTNKKVSVVFGTYREKNSIRRVIEDFFATGYVDEVVVVNNNAEPGTDDEVKKTKACLVFEPRQGYGYAYRRGIEEATGDYVILCEADATFLAHDLEKFLVYAKDFPAVFGTRTNQSSILEGAAMGFLRKWANVLEAKIIEILFLTNSITDIGCTYKLLGREVVEKLRPRLRETNALLATEILLWCVALRIPFVEIPIAFGERVGESQLTGQWYKLIRWGTQILVFIFNFWFKWIFSKLYV